MARPDLQQNHPKHCTRSTRILESLPAWVLLLTQTLTLTLFFYIALRVFVKLFLALIRSEIVSLALMRTFSSCFLCLVY